MYPGNSWHPSFLHGDGKRNGKINKSDVIHCPDERGLSILIYYRPESFRGVPRKTHKFHGNTSALSS